MKNLVPRISYLLLIRGVNTHYYHSSKFPTRAKLIRQIAEDNTHFLPWDIKSQNNSDRRVPPCWLAFRMLEGAGMTVVEDYQLIGNLWSIITASITSYDMGTIVAQISLSENIQDLLNWRKHVWYHKLYQELRVRQLMGSVGEPTTIISLSIPIDIGNPHQKMNAKTHSWSKYIK